MAQRLIQRVQQPQALAGLEALFTLAREREAQGEGVAGFKIALNAVGVQESFGLEGPLLGYLPKATGCPDGGSLPLSADGHYLVECEVAIQVGADLREDVSAEVAAESITEVAPALEVLRLAGPPSDLSELLQGNALHANWALGAARPFDGEFSMTSLELELATRRGDARDLDPTLVVGEPGQIVAFVARLAGQFGRRLKRGDWILCGSLNQPMRISAGDVIEARLRPLGVVGLRCTG